MKKKILQENKYDLIKIKALLAKSRAKRNVAQISHDKFKGETGMVLAEALDYAQHDWIANNLSVLTVTYESDGTIEDVLKIRNEGKLHHYDESGLLV